ncbi:MAG: AraC family transcriptional regulator [Tannerellaceae bacterium]|nr:AraC family transcriptional regulator [Tannerellaceae bacterium]
MVFSRVKKRFTFPVHIHTEYELNFVENAKGVQRIVGDSVETIGDLDLTLITGAELEHAWVDHQCQSEEIREITFQFHPNLLSESLLSKNAFKSTEKLLRNAQRGVTFSESMIRKVKPRLERLSENSQEISSVLELIHILHDLSLDPDYRILSSSSMNGLTCPIESRRIEKVYAYIEENYSRGDIRLADVAGMTGMTEVAFCRFIKKSTGKSFVDMLNDIRLGHAAGLLISTTRNISEICYECGFNNLSNFNRLFLKKKKCTPKTFRENYAYKRILI